MRLTSPSSKPLQGVRVIDFTHVLAGPACSYYLSLLGADVIKVESPNVGDCMRHRGGSDRELAAEAMSTAYITQGSGKRSIAVDLNHSEGLAVMKLLLQDADVFVENHRPSTMQRLRLSYDDVKEINPKLIHCAMTGYGRGGPKGDAPAYDINIQAACGLMTLTGEQDSGPVRTGAPIMDYGTGLAAGFAVSTALYQRHITGQGTFIDVSMLEVGLSLMSSTLTDYLSTGKVPQAAGNAANSRSPGAGCFATKHGTLSLGVNEEHQFWALMDVFGCSNLRQDNRLKDRTSRMTHQNFISELLAEKLKQRTAKEWETLMLNNGVPAAVVQTLPECLTQEQVTERQFVHSLKGEFSSIKVPTLPFRLGDEKSHYPDSPPPKRGEQSVELLKELGVSQARIDHLLSLKVVETPE